MPVSGGVLVESLDWRKETACQKALEMLEAEGVKPDFVLVAGDSRDDEPVFEWATEHAKEHGIKNLTTIKVGTGHSSANATTTGVAGKSIILNITDLGRC